MQISNASRRLTQVALFVLAAPAFGYDGQVKPMKPNETVYDVRTVHWIDSGDPIPFGCHRTLNISPVTTGDCPVKDYNSGHGQCSGGHPPNSGKHGLASKPGFAFNASPDPICATGDAHVTHVFGAPNFAGLYLHEYLSYRYPGDPDPYYHYEYFFVKLGSGTDTPLIPLPVANATYTRVGAAGYPWHNPGYSDPEWATHWGTPGLVAATVLLAQDWLGLDPDSCGCNPCPKLKINDMSLELGGAFDIGGLWAPPHVGHENGKKVDIASGRQTADGVPVDILSESYFCAIAANSGFSVICLEREASDPPPPSICGDQSGCAVSSAEHWHLEVP